MEQRIVEELNAVSPRPPTLSKSGVREVAGAEIRRAGWTPIGWVFEAKGGEDFVLPEDPEHRDKRFYENPQGKSVVTEFVVKVKKKDGIFRRKSLTFNYYLEDQIWAAAN